jgi:hypothetical protein
MLATFVGVLLFLWSFATAICALYTPLVFGLLDIDPFALHVLSGTISTDQLTSYDRFGLTFSPSEIQHFLDVARIVMGVQTAMGLLLAALVAITLARPGLRLAASTRALGFLAGTITLVSFGYLGVGYEVLSDFLHGFAFEPSSHIFTPQSLTGHIYANEDMMAGAGFVIAAATLTLFATWLAARITLPIPALRARDARQKRDGAL